MWLHPEAPPLRVLAVERERAIVLEKCWTFFLQPIDEHSTRLIVRGRGNFNPDFKNALLNFLFWRVVFEPAHFIMERKMLLGIKERVEQNGALRRELNGPIHSTQILRTTPAAYARPAAVAPTKNVVNPELHHDAVDQRLLAEPMAKKTAPVITIETMRASDKRSK